MCPACLVSVAWIAGGATLAGGATVLAVRRVRVLLLLQRVVRRRLKQVV